MESGWFTENFFIDKGIITLLFILFLFVFRQICIKAIRNINRPWTSEQRLRSIGYVKSSFFAIVFLGCLFIWGTQVASFAMSIFAIAFALVFSVKELFMCVNGSVMRFRGNVYNLGDRIEVNGLRGDVIDINLLCTTLLELGPDSHHHTGRVMTFPNSFVMYNSVMNETFIDHFFIHNIRIPIQLTENWKEARDILLKIAKEECSPYIEQARRRMKETARRKSIEFISVEPRVRVQIPEPGMIHLILRFPSPVHLKGRLEQTIMSKFLDQFFPSKQEDSIEMSTQDV